MAALEEKLAEAVRQFPVLYDKSCRDFKDNSKKSLAWDDVTNQVGLQTGMYSSSEYSFICLMFSLVRIMLLYGCSFLRFFRLSINYPGACCVWFCCRRLLRRMRIKSNSKSSNLSSSPESAILNVSNESEAYDSASEVPIHTRSELS